MADSDIQLGVFAHRSCCTRFHVLKIKGWPVSQSRNIWAVGAISSDDDAFAVPNYSHSRQQRLRKTGI